jgi:hypothetical protein
MIGGEIPHISLLLPGADCQTGEKEKVRSI